MSKKFFSICTFLCLISTFAWAENVTKISISGNKRIEKETILSFIKFNIGEKISEEKIDKSIKSLYATNLFSHIDIINTHGQITINLIENPKINKIFFEGNKRIKDNEIESEISLHPRAIYTKTKLQNDINRIIDIYSAQGRYGVKITPKIVKLPQNRIDLIFEIEEGQKSKIETINFIGNTKFTDNTLKSVINSQEAVWYNFLTSHDKYNPYAIEFDKELLSKFYKSKGYAKFQVISSVANINEKRDKFDITFTLEEGKKYKYNKIDLVSNIKNLSTENLDKLISTKTNKTYNINEVEKTVKNLTRAINDLGYAFIAIEPVYVFNDDNHIIDITYNILEGSKAYLGRINIQGNKRTSDKVIRREFKIEEGDPFNATKILQSEKRIKDLDFFELVEIKQKATKERDIFDLDVNVKEKSTAFIQFAGGYNTTEGPIGLISLNETNLFGNGQLLTLGVSKARRKLDFDVNFVEPYFMDLPLSSGIEFYRSNAGKDDRHFRLYSNESIGGALKVGYEITDNLTHGLRYAFGRNNITDVHTNASSFIKEQKGKTTSSSIAHTLTFDVRDSKIQPSQGFIGFFDQQFTGIGGSKRFIKHEIGGGYYIPVYGDNVILELSAKAGHIKALANKNVRIDDRFFLGGDDLRGFDFAGIGPRAKKYINDQEIKDNYKGDSLGGNKYYLGSAEVKFPITTSQKEMAIFGIAFLDAGEVYGPNINKHDRNKVFQDRGIRSSTGIGLGFNTPMGPIKLTYAIPISKKKFDSVDRFYITFSTTKF